MRIAIILTGSAFLAACTALNAQPVCDDPRGGCNPPPGARANGTQTLGDFRQDDPDPTNSRRPVLGTGVAVPNAIVSAVDNYVESARGTIGDIWVQQRITDPLFQGCVPDPIGGGHVCGIQLYQPVTIPSGSTTIPGDLVDVEGGTYEEFACPTCGGGFPDGRTLPEFGMSNVSHLGSTGSPVPVAVTLQQVNDGGDAFVGVLVRITDLVTANPMDSRGEMLIDSATPFGSTVTLTPQIGALSDENGAPLQGGVRLCNLTGIVSYFYNQKLMPRGPSDYQIVAPGVQDCPAQQ